MEKPICPSCGNEMTYTGGIGREGTYVCLFKGCPTNLPDQDDQANRDPKDDD